MKTFTRQTATNTPAIIDFGAASDQVARVLDPGVSPHADLRAEELREPHPDHDAETKSRNPTISRPNSMNHASEI
jgi:hypothetical protein